MKAIRYYTYGSPDVLQLQDVEMPAIGGDELLIRVRAASVNPLDWHFMRARRTSRGSSSASCFPHDGIVLHKPASITFEQAAAVPVAGFTALQALRDKGRLQAGQKVLVNGAAGGVGTFAVQIAKALGAEVTGVCSTANVELVDRLAPTT